MKKLFLFFSVVFGVIFFWGCVAKYEQNIKPEVKYLKSKLEDYFRVDNYDVYISKDYKKLILCPVSAKLDGLVFEKIEIDMGRLGKMRLIDRRWALNKKIKCENINKDNFFVKKIKPVDYYSSLYFISFDKKPYLFFRLDKKIKADMTSQDISGFLIYWVKVNKYYKFPIFILDKKDELLNKILEDLDDRRIISLDSCCNVPLYSEYLETALKFMKKFGKEKYLLMKIYIDKKLEEGFKKVKNNPRELKEFLSFHPEFSNRDETKTTFCNEYYHRIYSNLTYQKALNWWKKCRDYSSYKDVIESYLSRKYVVNNKKRLNLSKYCSDNFNWSGGLDKKGYPTGYGEISCDKKLSFKQTGWFEGYLVKGYVKIYGNFNDGNIYNGKVVYIIKAHPAAALGYAKGFEVSRGEVKFKKFTPALISEAQKIAQNSYKEDYLYSTTSSTTNKQNGIYIKNCYNKTCRVKLDGNYIGAVSYWTQSYSGGTYYVISFLSDVAKFSSEQGNYYPKTNEIYMSKCGTKRGVYSLQQAMKYVVKCAVSGHY